MKFVGCEMHGDRYEITQELLTKIDFIWFSSGKRFVKAKRIK